MTDRVPRARPDLQPDLELDVGPVAAGGHCVARDEGRVVFVRHALPGERVRARVTEDAGRYLRADAVEIHTPSPERVEAPCPHAGPGRCGGCDWQHASAAAQRMMKADVVREAFRRIGGLSTVDVEVAEVPGGLLRWRTRGQFAVDRRGRIGLRQHRSHAIEPIDSCPLMTRAAGSALDTVDAPPPGSTVEVAASAAGETAVDVRRGRRRRAAGAALHEQAAGRAWQVHSGAFWQVHPAAADTLARCVLELAAPREGEWALDLYAGAGLLGGVLAPRLGPRGRVICVEIDPVAAQDARANLAAFAQADVLQSAVSAEVVAALPGTALSGSHRATGEPAGIVVLDPPRAGTGPDVMRAVIGLRPRAMVYVSCDAATLARDVRVASDAGWRLVMIRAFDVFPMTQHVECVALLTAAGR